LLIEYWFNKKQPTDRMVEIKELLEDLKEVPDIEVRFVEASQKSLEERKELYFGELSNWANRTGNRIRRILRYDRKDDRVDYGFGIKRPMLLVYEDDELKEVYPRREAYDNAVGDFSGSLYVTVTIQEFLSEL